MDKWLQLGKTVGVHEVKIKIWSSDETTAQYGMAGRSVDLLYLLGHYSYKFNIVNC